MKDKVCHICGRPIEKGELYYCIGTDTYVCSNDGCYEVSYWERVVQNYRTHSDSYVVLDGLLFQVDENGQEGYYYSVEFENGTRRTMGPLRCLATIPKDKKEIFNDVIAYVVPRGVIL